MQDTLQPIIDLLNSPDDDVRMVGIERMATEGGERAVPYLLDAMKDKSIRLKNKAGSLLLGMSPGDVIPRLEEGLRDGVDADRRNAAMEIYTGFGPYSVDALTALLKDDDEEIRNFACVMLGDIGSSEATEHLLLALGDPSAIVGHAAAEALGKIGDPRAVEPLVSMLDPSDFWTVFPAVSALGEIGDERAVFPLIRLLDNEMLASATARALGGIASPAALPSLLPLLGSDNEAIRTDVFLACMSIQEKMLSGAERADEGFVEPAFLAEMDPGPFRAFLMGLTSSDEAAARSAAVKALGWLKEDRAADRMIGLLVDEDTSGAALDALVAIGPAALTDVRKNLGHPVGMVRQALVGYLGTLGISDGGPLLKKMLSDEMSIVRAQAALALGGLRDDSAADELIAALGDENPEVQEAAISALASLDPKLVCEKLLPYLKDENPQFMFLAAETLGYLGLTDAVGPLAALLDDPREIIREVAVKSLGRIGGHEAAAPLMRALSDESKRVKQQAIASLGKVREPVVVAGLVKLVEDGDDADRYYAVRALKEQGDVSVAGVLAGLLNDKHKNIVIAAIEALGALPDSSSCGALCDAAKNPDRDLARTAAEALGRLRCTEARDVLTGLLGHEHWSVRSVAAVSLGMVGGDGAYEALTKMAGDADHVVMKAAVRALGELGDVRAAGMLVGLLESPDAASEAQDALVMLGPGAVDGITEALDGSEPQKIVKGIRLMALGGLSGASGFIAGLVRHPEVTVRREAVNALGRLGGADTIGVLEGVRDTDPEEIVRVAAAGAVDRLDKAAG